MDHLDGMSQRQPLQIVDHGCPVIVEHAFGAQFEKHVVGISPPRVVRDRSVVYNARQGRPRRVPKLDVYFSHIASRQRVACVRFPLGKFSWLRKVSSNENDRDACRFLCSCCIHSFACELLVGVLSVSGLDLDDNEQRITVVGLNDHIWLGVDTAVLR